MQAPADKTAKRLSVEEWHARYDAIDLIKAQLSAPRERPRIDAQIPADRVATRT